MFGEGLTLYLQSEEEGELRLRPVARGEEAVQRLMKKMELRLEAGRLVFTRRGVHVGFAVRTADDIHRIRVDYEEYGPPMIFLETPR